MPRREPRSPIDDGSPAVITSLVELADASQTLVVDQFRLLRVETVAELRGVLSWAAALGVVAGLGLLGIGLLLAGVVTGLAPMVGLASAFGSAGVVAGALSSLFAWLGASMLRSDNGGGAT